MGFPFGGAAQIWRDAGAHNPAKAEIRDYLGVLESAAKTFETLAEAVNSTKLTEGLMFRVKERETGKGGGALWRVVLASSVTPNDIHIMPTAVVALAAVLVTGQ